MQLRFETGLTGERYVTAQAWREARLERCPKHPHGGCSLARHGTYERKTPQGVRVARWYCPQSHTTFSLLPDCLAARLPGTLEVLEAVVVAAEGARSLEAAANEVRPDAIELPGAMRWVRRRVRLVHNALARVIGLTVGKGGDTDTNAAITGALLGAADGLGAIPPRWVMPVQACRPHEALDALNPRSMTYWPDDLAAIAEALLVARPASETPFASA